MTDHPGDIQKTMTIEDFNKRHQMMEEERKLEIKKMNDKHSSPTKGTICPICYKGIIALLKVGYYDPDSVILDPTGKLCIENKTFYGNTLLIGVGKVNNVDVRAGSLICYSPEITNVTCEWDITIYHDDAFVSTNIKTNEKCCYKHLHSQ
ncbi:MAG: hypothetical protein Edafosvirus21_12 [Edafosvirus sp.]|uniref:Uncharacterized protein n=1 Tax=Edafosvirus sp. TaxID=2487765 RepID=A0A3G4ZYI1_9VIRU|nr:MAG: hypothetical protein Edafosvirus21_12 [Edafosvirus sp.]